MYTDSLYWQIYDVGYFRTDRPIKQLHLIEAINKSNKIGLKISELDRTKLKPNPIKENQTKPNQRKETKENKSNQTKSFKINLNQKEKEKVNETKSNHQNFSFQNWNKL